MNETYRIRTIRKLNGEIFRDMFIDGHKSELSPKGKIKNVFDEHREILNKYSHINEIESIIIK